MKILRIFVLGWAWAATAPALAQPLAKFRAQLLSDSVAIGYGLAIGEVDGDGRPDILLADKKQFVWYRNGDWRRFVLAENLTPHDNVCLAARDVDGDGRVEIAVGAQWNPAETSDTTQSGAVFWLQRPTDPTQPWAAHRLPAEPTVHRMRWVRTPPDRFSLVVAPLHGRGNRDGRGAGVRVWAYQPPPGWPNQAIGPWARHLVDSTLHITHNFDVEETDQNTRLYLGGAEGVKILASTPAGPWQALGWLQQTHGVSELKRTPTGVLAAVEPFHGNVVSVWQASGATYRRQLLANDLAQGHALAFADLMGLGRPQIIVGWRLPNPGRKTGIRLYAPTDADLAQWQPWLVDEGGMACEDLQIADLNADGKPDIVAAGRATNNLKIYWNEY
jgi:FG-GAP-like repeat